MVHQIILSRKPEGDSKLTELRRHSQSLSDQEELEEEARREAQQTVRDSEERWTTVLRAAESSLQSAEVQYSLSRELEAFRGRAAGTDGWVGKLRQQAGARGGGARGSRAEIEERLTTAQVRHGVVCRITGERGRSAASHQSPRGRVFRRP